MTDNDDLRERVAKALEPVAWLYEGIHQADQNLPNDKRRWVERVVMVKPDDSVHWIRNVRPLFTHLSATPIEPLQQRVERLEGALRRIANPDNCGCVACGDTAESALGDDSWRLPTAPRYPALRPEPASRLGHSAGIAIADEPEPHDAHVQAAHAIFRKAGFTLAAMQYKRSVGDLIRLKRFNGLADDAKVPHAWFYHPNEWCARKAGDL